MLLHVYIVARKPSSRLGMYMLADADGPGNIQFINWRLSQGISTAALILLQGGQATPGVRCEKSSKAACRWQP